MRSGISLGTSGSSRSWGSGKPGAHPTLPPCSWGRTPSGGWTQDPTELVLCVVASLVTFFFITSDITRRKGMVWSDTLGLSAFGLVGCHVALEFGAPLIIAVFMGMVTATGGGVIRDVLTNTQPIILCGQPYVTAALLGSLSYASLRHFGVLEIASETVAFLAAFALRASAILFDIRMARPGSSSGWESRRKIND